MSRLINMDRKEFLIYTCDEPIIGIGANTETLMRVSIAVSLLG